MIIAYDTETTGLPDWGAPSDADHQPHLVQLAMILLDDDHTERASVSLIIKPDGWTIPDEVAKIHGITTEKAMDLGVHEDLALEMFMGMWAGRLRIAHNESFDARIIRIAQHRFTTVCDDEQRDAWKAGKTECTQLISTPILKLPPTAKMIAARRNHHKSANLSEAYKFFTGNDLVDAHSAMADVQACMAVYFAAKDHDAAAKAFA